MLKKKIKGLLKFTDNGQWKPKSSTYLGLDSKSYQKQADSTCMNFIVETYNVSLYALPTMSRHAPDEI